MMPLASSRKPAGLRGTFANKKIQKPDKLDFGFFIYTFFISYLST